MRLRTSQLSKACFYGLDAPAERPVGVTEGSPTENLNKTGVRFWT